MNNQPQSLSVYEILFQIKNTLYVKKKIIVNKLWRKSTIWLSPKK